MASAGSKRPRDPSVQKSKVKFLINIPVKVDSEDQAMARCRYLLEALQSEGFKEADKKMVENVAVVFGMNGEYSPQLDQVLKKLQTFRYKCNVRYSIITYTWGNGGTIAKDATMIPFQSIREYLKSNPATTKLVEELRGNDPSCLVYFSFVDSDTFRFNSIYSEYLQIIQEERDLPTVMSTGYEFHTGSDYHIASYLDRMVRTALAEVNPLFVYYPEPNFCVLVPDSCNTIKESFINRKRNNMESAVLISQVKNRPNFKAVFLDRNPIIIDIPARFNLTADGLKTGQSTLDGMNLAKSVNCNKVLTNAQTFSKEGLTNEIKKIKGIAGKNRGYIIMLYNAKTDRDIEELIPKNPFEINGQVAKCLTDAIIEARECKMFFEEFDRKLDG